MPPRVRPFSEADRRAAIELWKAKVPLKNIRAQLQMIERGLRKIIAYAKHHPEDPIPKKIKNAGGPTKISLGAIREIKKRIARNPCITAQNLKNIPQLEDVSIHTIQSFCKEQLKLPCRKMADKTLLTKRIKNNRLELSR